MDFKEEIKRIAESTEAISAKYKILNDPKRRQAILFIIKNAGRIRAAEAVEENRCGACGAEPGQFCHGYSEDPIGNTHATRWIKESR